MWCISCNRNVEKVSLSIGNQGMIEVGLIYLLCTYLNFKPEKLLLWDQVFARGVGVANYSRYFDNSCSR